jgi:hypothetical protein
MIRFICCGLFLGVRIMGNYKAFRALAASALMIAASPPADAGWLSVLVREAGEAGGKAASHAHPNLGAAGRAAEHLSGLKAAPKGALAAHATPEGHWQFVNREGQTFTAGTAEELKRAGAALIPDGAGNNKLTLYLSEDSVFDSRIHLDKLPKDADLHVVTEDGAFALIRKGEAKSEKLFAKLKPNLTIELTEQALFDEAASALGRTLNKSNIRTIALEPAASNLLSSAPRIDPATKAAIVDQLDPVQLAKAFRSIKGQTALVTGRVENGKLFFKPSSGPELSRDIEELMSAAAHNDVNLVVLHAETPRQPGGRNWLWQKIEVGGLDEAISKATFGDFLEALAAKSGPLTLSAEREGGGRVAINAKPFEESMSITATASHTMDEWIGHITGEVVTKAAELHVRDTSSQSETDAQLIPGIPSYVQIPYIVGMVCGVFGFGTVRNWWQRLAGNPVPREGESGWRTKLRTLPGTFVFWFLFLPFLGLPALMWGMAVEVWSKITAPFRWLKRRFGGTPA